MDIIWADRATVSPNAYNPNEMTPAQLRATAESLAEFGWRVPIQANTREDGTYEITDGEHRWLASGYVYLLPADPLDPADDVLRPTVTAENVDAVNAGRKKGQLLNVGDPLPVQAPQGEGDPGIPHGYRRGVVMGEDTRPPHGALRAFPYVPLILCDDLSESQRKKLTVVLDTTRGEMNLVRLGGLLAQLKDELGLDALAHSLPFPQVELEQMATLGVHDWGQYSDPPPPPAPSSASSSEPTGYRTLTVKLTLSDHTAVMDAYSAVEAALGGLPQHEAEALGEVFALLARDYLGAGQDADAPQEPALAPT